MLPHPETVLYTPDWRRPLLSSTRPFIFIFIFIYFHTHKIICSFNFRHSPTRATAIWCFVRALVVVVVQYTDPGRNSGMVRSLRWRCTKNKPIVSKTLTTSDILPLQRHQPTLLYQHQRNDLKPNFMTLWRGEISGTANVERNHRSAKEERLHLK